MLPIRFTRYALLGLVVVTSAIARAPVASCAPFTNLDFEQATVVINDPMFGHLDWALALPGWSPPAGVPDTASVYLGASHLGLTPYVMLVDRDHVPPPPLLPRDSIAGRFSLSMRPSLEPGLGDVWITQTGDVPAGAKAFELLVRGSAPQIFLNDVPISLVEVDQVGSAKQFAGNITAFAGTTVELKIFYPEPLVFDEESPARGGTLDNLQFTTRVIPEPSTLALAVLGGIAVVVVRRRPRG